VIYLQFLDFLFLSYIS